MKYVSVFHHFRVGVEGQMLKCIWLPFYGSAFYGFVL